MKCFILLINPGSRHRTAAWATASARVSIGVGGTLYGVAKALREELPGVKIVGVEPASANYPISGGYYRIPGVDGEVTGGIIEEMMESGIVDEVVKVTNHDAIEMSDRLVREEGLFCGVSSGANVFQALRIAEELGEDRRRARRP